MRRCTFPVRGIVFFIILATFAIGRKRSCSLKRGLDRSLPSPPESSTLSPPKLFSPVGENVVQKCNFSKKVSQLLSPSDWTINWASFVRNAEPKSWLASLVSMLVKFEVDLVDVIIGNVCIQSVIIKLHAIGWSASSPSFLSSDVSGQIVSIFSITSNSETLTHQVWNWNEARNIFFFFTKAFDWYRWIKTITIE